MRKGGGKSKGSSFERKIAKELGIAMFNDKNTFVRTPSSGAMATISKSNNVAFAGDIMQVAHLDEYVFPYCIECKHYKNFDPFNLLIEKKNSPEMKAWKQAVSNAANSDGKLPLLIFKANNRPIYIAYYTSNATLDSEILGSGLGHRISVASYDELLSVLADDITVRL